MLNLYYCLYLNEMRVCVRNFFFIRDKIFLADFFKVFVAMFNYLLNI